MTVTSNDLRISLKMDSSGLLTLNSGSVNVNYISVLPADDDAAGWVTLTCVSSEVNITRGVDRFSNIFARTQAGDCVVTAHGEGVDPVLNTLLRPGMLMRVSAWVDEQPYSDSPEDFPKWVPVWTGHLKDMSTTYSKTRDAVTVFTGVDSWDTVANLAVSDLAGPQSPHDRLSTSLALKTGDYAISAASPEAQATLQNRTSISPLDNEYKFSDVLQMTADSVRGFAYVDKHGNVGMISGELIEEQIAQGVDPQIAFSDFEGGGFDQSFSHEWSMTYDRHSCFNDISITYDMNNVINTISVKNIYTSDVDGNDITEDLGTFTDDSSVNRYGERNVDVLTNIATYGRVETLVAGTLNAHSEPQKKVSDLVFRPEHRWIYDVLDIGAWVWVSLHDKNNNELLSQYYLVTGISHDITIDHWEITLDFYRPNTCEVIMDDALEVYVDPGNPDSYAGGTAMYDMSGNGNDWTWTTAPTLDSDVGGAQLNGSVCAYLNNTGANLLCNLTEASIFGWVKLTHVGNNVSIGSGQGSNDRIELLYSGSGNVGAYVGNGGTYVLATTPALDTEWHHVGLVYKGNGGATNYDKIELYFDGDLVADTVQVGTMPAVTPATTSGAWIGYRQSSGYSNGWVASTYWYSRSLNSIEVKQMFNAEVLRYRDTYPSKHYGVTLP